MPRELGQAAALEPDADGAPGWFGPPLAHATLGLTVMDADARLLHLNGALARLLGRPGPDLGAQPLFEALRPEDGDVLRAALSRVLGGEVEVERVQLTPALGPAGELPAVGALLAATRVDGRPACVGVFGPPSAALDGDGATPAAMLEAAVGREVEARRAAERALGLNELFVGMLGHDLRNPLGAILVGAQYLLRLGGSEAQLRTARRIVASAERMARMIDELLDFTRIRAGRGLSMRLQAASLSELCARTTEELEQVEPRARFACATFGDPAGVWDPDRLAQVLSNLLGNAVHHGDLSQPIGVRIDGQSPSEVVVEIQNRGTIPAELLPTIFDPFSGSERAERHAHSLGLGLFITKQIVEAHGGAIDVYTSADDGTAFRVRLPRGPRTAT